MNRREFMQKVSGFLATIPIVSFFVSGTKASGLVEEVKPNTVKSYKFLDSIKFSESIQQKFNNSHPNLPFLERTKIVKADDIEILAYGGYISKGYTSDIISNDGTINDIDCTGQVSNAIIPNIKMGSRLSAQIVNTARRVNNEIDKTNSIKFITDYEEQLADNLILGVKQTLNMQILQVMLGGNLDLPSRVKVKMDVPEGLHVKVDWSKPLTAIKSHTEKLASTYGETVDRMTLSTLAYKRLIESTEFEEAFLKYRKDHKVRFEEYIDGYRAKNNNVEPSELNITMYFAPSVLSKNGNITPDLYDSIYRMRSNDGKSKAERVLPDNKILFSNSRNDLDGMTIDYAQGIVTESIVSHLITGSTEFGGASFGPIGYFTGNRDLNPPDIRAWAVMRGLPRLHNKTAFSSFMI